MVDKELFDAYSEAMRTIATLVQNETKSLVASIDPFDDPSANALKLLGRYRELVAEYGTVAVTAAREYYQSARDLAVEQGYADGAYEAVTAQTVRREWADEDVQKAVQRGEDTLPGMAVRRIMQRGDHTIAVNMERDPSSPRWAIIPHPGACGWCVMVASNGWAYSSERSANAQRHDNCRCSVAVDWDTSNPYLAGYDPDALYRQYQQGIEDAGDVYAKWNALTQDERDSYKRKGRSAFDVFKTKQIAAAMDRRMHGADE